MLTRICQPVPPDKFLPLVISYGRFEEGVPGSDDLSANMSPPGTSDSSKFWSGGGGDHFGRGFSFRGLNLKVFSGVFSGDDMFADSSSKGVASS